MVRVSANLAIFRTQLLLSVLLALQSIHSVLCVWKVQECHPVRPVRPATIQMESPASFAQQLSLVVYNAQTMAPVAHCVTQETTLLKAEASVFV